MEKTSVVVLLFEMVNPFALRKGTMGKRGRYLNGIRSAGRNELVEA